MKGQPSQHPSDLAQKIARLIEERGWNQEEFSRAAQLNRQTVRQIFHDGARQLRNTTVLACATALGLSVSDLKSTPLERLLPRMRHNGQPHGEEALKQLYELATQPELRAWIDRNPQRAEHLYAAEVDELLSLQGVGGPLTSFGVDHFVGQIERRRELMLKVRAVAGTELVDLLERLVDLLYEKVQPYGDRR
jgi:transcriptional regulator with XRE-family HTH domain